MAINKEITYTMVVTLDHGIQITADNITQSNKEDLIQNMASNRYITIRGSKDTTVNAEHIRTIQFTKNKTTGE